jgi:hypothetical protein
VDGLSDYIAKVLGLRVLVGNRLFPLYSLIGLLKGLYSYFEYKNNYIHEIFIGLFWI